MFHPVSAIVLIAMAMLIAPAPVFAKSKVICMACHKTTVESKVGPGWGSGEVNGQKVAAIFGRKAGSMPGFNYTFTKFIKPGKAWAWDEAHLRAWMCDAPKAIKEFTGNPSAKARMIRLKICDAAKQDKILALMRGVK